MSKYYDDNFPEVLGLLQRAGIALQEAGAEAMNKGANFIAGRYRLELQENTRLRNEAFTLRGIKVYKAHALRSDKKTLRKMKDINAKVGVIQFQSGREHYLAMLEFGSTKKGNPKLGNKVAIPLDSSRIGDDRNKPVKGDMRLEAGLRRYKGKVDLSKFAGNPRQQYAIMQSMARSGKLYTQNKSHQTSIHGMWSADYGNGKGYMFSISRKGAKIVRDLSYSSVRVQAKPLFQTATKEITQAMLDRWWVESAKELLAELDKR